MKRLLSLTAIIAIMILCIAELSSCSKNTKDQPEAPVTDDVRITSIYGIALMTNGDTMFITNNDYTWQNGLIDEIHTVMSFPNLNSTTTETKRFVYNGQNCTECIITSNLGDSKQTFTYSAGRLQSAVRVMNGQTIESTQISSYTNDGLVHKMTCSNNNSGSVVTKEYTLTWQDGDLVSYLVHPIEPAGADEVVNGMLFDNYPSVYTGLPLAEHISDISYLSFRGNKHNKITIDEVNQYKNSRLVKKTTGTNTFYYTYSDGTSCDLEK